MSARPRGVIKYALYILLWSALSTSTAAAENRASGASELFSIARISDQQRDKMFTRLNLETGLSINGWTTAPHTLRTEFSTLKQHFGLSWTGLDWRSYYVGAARGDLGFGFNGDGRYQLDSFDIETDVFRTAGNVWAFFEKIYFFSSIVSREKALGENLSLTSYLTEMALAAAVGITWIELGTSLLGYRHKNYYVGDSFHGFVPLTADAHFLLTLPEFEEPILSLGFNLHADIALPLQSNLAAKANIGSVIEMPWADLNIMLYGGREYSYDHNRSFPSAAFWSAGLTVGIEYKLMQPQPKCANNAVNFPRCSTCTNVRADPAMQCKECYPRYTGYPDCKQCSDDLYDPDYFCRQCKKGFTGYPQCHPKPLPSIGIDENNLEHEIESLLHLLSIADHSFYGCETPKGTVFFRYAGIERPLDYPTLRFEAVHDLKSRVNSCTNPNLWTVNARQSCVFFEDPRPVAWILRLLVKQDSLPQNVTERISFFNSRVVFAPGVDAAMARRAYPCELHAPWPGWEHGDADRDGTKNLYDCAPHDPKRWQYRVVLKETNSDRYRKTDAAIICAGDTLPPGYKAWPYKN